jgi:hypothetical protein
MLVSGLACLGFWATKESRASIGLVVLALTFPLWWILADQLTPIVIVASIALFIAAMFFLVVNYDQIQVERETTQEQSIPGIYLAVAIIGLFIGWFAPLEVDRIQAILLGVGLGLMFAWLFKSIGIRFALPTLILVAILPLVGVIFYPELIWTQLINTALTIGIWSSLGAYAVLTR